MIGFVIVMVLQVPVPVNVGRSVPHYSNAVQQSGPWTVWVSSEAEEGAQDLDGDGLALSMVLFVRDDRTGLVQNLRRAVASSSSQLFLTVRGNFVFAAVIEDPAQLAQESPDAFIHLVHLPTSTVLETDLRTFGAIPNAENDVVAVGVLESLNGDLNGDGDEFDAVHLVWSAPDGAPLNTGLAAPFGAEVEDGAVILAVHEKGQGGADLNGDGDVSDHVLHLFDLERRRAFNLGKAGAPLFGAGRTGLVVVDEWDEGEDLDGNGLLFDRVYHAIDASGPGLRNLGVTSTAPGGNVFEHIYSTGTAVALPAWVGPPPTLPSAYLWLPDERSLVPTGVVGVPSGVWVDPETGAPALIFDTSEILYGIDANGNGSVSDPVAAVWRESSGVELLPWAGRVAEGGFPETPRTSGPIVHVLVREALQGADLDGDGLLNGEVTLLHDISDGSEAVFPELATTPVRYPTLSGRRLFGIGPAGLRAVELGSFMASEAGVEFKVCPDPCPPGCIPYPEDYDAGRAAGVVEEAAAGQDLNGDGDLADLVLHVVH